MVGVNSQPVNFSFDVAPTIDWVHLQSVYACRLQLKVNIFSSCCRVNGGLWSASRSRDTRDFVNNNSKTQSRFLLSLSMGGRIVGRWNVRLLKWMKQGLGFTVKFKKTKEEGHSRTQSWFCLGIAQAGAWMHVCGESEMWQLSRIRNSAVCDMKRWQLSRKVVSAHHFEKHLLSEKNEEATQVKPNSLNPNISQTTKSRST